MGQTLLCTGVCVEHPNEQNPPTNHTACNSIRGRPIGPMPGSYGTAQVLNAYKYAFRTHIGRAGRHTNLQASGVPACTPFCNGVRLSTPFRLSADGPQDVKPPNFFSPVFLESVLQTLRLVWESTP
ncbi:uncharacterized protein PGTG_15645 [Puccinia graminis f. sp. tritici CRL 75-36-700-3]|uniref:Uncharacterized protein n=1 Tax=Puccinia graminis f. sp. tritici (strain CRL 75-36-700-3 / race SCCL) TaxID=418459 RepID=E3KZF7_PUCGT|nr:uncharacterized protein PGTG_15645 [Puccinia graminis f. sp. tritici CRL 75-36-700-3]EFP89682.1 hypothetical protein PGTG_15645 [Puccinia graminis f. sp. tritici CRL 75-36-700-3]